MYHGANVDAVRRDRENALTCDGFAAVLVVLGGLVDEDSAGGVGDPFAEMNVDKTKLAPASADAEVEE